MKLANQYLIQCQGFYSEGILFLMASRSKLSASTHNHVQTYLVQLHERHPIIHMWLYLFFGIGNTSLSLYGGLMTDGPITVDDNSAGNCIRLF